MSIPQEENCDHVASYHLIISNNHTYSRICLPTKTLDSLHRYAINSKKKILVVLGICLHSCFFWLLRRHK